MVPIIIPKKVEICKGYFGIFYKFHGGGRGSHLFLLLRFFLRRYNSILKNMS